MTQADPTGGEADALDAMRELEQAREYHRLRAWSNAYRSFLRAEKAAPLAAPDLDLFATAAYLVGRDAEYSECARTCPSCASRHWRMSAYFRANERGLEAQPGLALLTTTT
jgi:hypothetical protein